MNPVVDLVVPVYNSPHHARACLRSILAHADVPSRLIVVDDCSDAYTGAILRELLSSPPDTVQTCYLRNDRNLGYLQSVNRGLREGEAPVVILVNSDTLLTPGALSRVLAGFEKDPKIGVINPVSTWANWTRIPFPEGANIYSLTDTVQRLGSGKWPDIRNASGFFFAIRRELLRDIGDFDEAYGFGYWEETDFCMRALSRGWQVVVDDSLYIFHHGWGSFQEEGRNENMRRNREIFMARWQSAFTEAETWWKRHNPVRPLSDALPGAFASRPGPGAPAASAIRARIDALRAGDPPRIPEAVPPPVPASRPRVIYVLPAVALYGGIISVLQVVNELLLNGFDANIATYGRVDEEMFRMFPMYFRPWRFDSMEEMVRCFPECDLVVATAWETVYPVTVLRELRPALRAVYFVQDFEPDFYTGERPDLVQLADRTYYLIPDQIVKTRWLARKLKPYGGRVRRIPLGLNLDFFHDEGNPRPKQILSLARPSSARRNFPMVCEVYRRLHTLRPDLTLALYGDGVNPQALDFPVRYYGKLGRMEEVARALNESLILLDCSTFQGFGRPGLEAMACGTAAVLTREGGITQYAKHRWNCLLIDPEDPDDIVRAILELIDDAGLRERLIANGQVTAADYATWMEGRRTATYFRELLGLAPPGSDGGSGV